MVLTEESQQDVYPALTFEGTWTDTTTAVAIEKLYYNVDSSKIVNASVATGITAYQNNNGNPPFNNNPKSNTTANSAKVYQMNGSVNKTGLTIALKVMAGDTINIYGKSYYNLNGGTISGTTTAPTTLALLTSFAGTNAMSSKGVSGTALNSITQLTSGITSLLGTQPAQTSNTPKAFINWILFDERFNYAGGGYDRVGSSGTVKNHNSSTIPSIVVPKNGYIYVYCNNESNINVFFDNLQIIHSRGPIVEETHYYPFGLTMAAISSKSVSFGAPTNRRKYNGKEEQRQEFSDGAGLELYDFGARQHDPQIGRWTTIDPLAQKRFWATPYNYVQNNPINRYDPNGLTDYTLNKKTGEVKQIGEKNDDPDRILRTKRNGEVRYKKNGKAKVDIEGIEKGILKDGQNFQNKDQVISVGGKGQPSVEGVKSFTLKLSEYVGKEIAGFSYSADGSKTVTDVVLGKYINNRVDESHVNPGELAKKYGSNFSANNILEDFHTHPDGNLGATQSDPHLSKDVERLQSEKPKIPNASFIILYRVTGWEQPEEYDYTHEYRPQKK